MRFASDDGTFGVVIAPSSPGQASDFFRFQLVIDGDRFGDEEPGILGSAMNFLMNVSQVDDERLAHAQSDPDSALSLAINDDTIELHDRVVFAHAESLDQWEVVSYGREGVVIWLVRSREAGSRANFAAVTATEYFEIVGQVKAYWDAHRSH